MYKHILVATDGSDLAQHAVESGLELAKTLGARVTALTVTMPWEAIAVGEMTVVSPPADYERRANAHAGDVLAKVRSSAEKYGLVFEGLHASHSQPFRAIIDAAEAKGCDLIVVGSHGRTGLERLFIGSQAAKLLTHSKIPVLVHRE
jgi:nucleotide-binding universal stress UspA family protein